MDHSMTVPKLCHGVDRDTRVTIIPPISARGGQVVIGYYAGIEKMI